MLSMFAKKPAQAVPFGRWSQYHACFTSSAKLNDEGNVYLQRGERMTELQHTVSTPELYERLIHRLGLALETASTAVRLRNELPAELELKGLSNAELEFIEAYLEKGAMSDDGAVKGKLEGSFIVSPEQTKSVVPPKESARIIWLKDKRRARVSTRPSRYNSNTTFKL